MCFIFGLAKVIIRPLIKTRLIAISSAGQFIFKQKQVTLVIQTRVHIITTRSCIEKQFNESNAIYIYAVLFLSSGLQYTSVEKWHAVLTSYLNACTIQKTVPKRTTVLVMFMTLIGRQRVCYSLQLLVVYNRQSLNR